MWECVCKEREREKYMSEWDFEIIKWKIGLDLKKLNASICFLISVVNENKFIIEKI